MWPKTAGDNEPCIWLLAEGAIRDLQASAAEDRFKKSLSMSGEVGSLAGDRVVSHERSRPADLSRRQDLRPRHAGPYPSHYCSCLSYCALLAHGHRCRKAVTARNVIRFTHLSAGNQLLLPRVHSLGMPCGRSRGRFPSTKPQRPVISFRTARIGEVLLPRSCAKTFCRRKSISARTEHTSQEVWRSLRW